MARKTEQSRKLQKRAEQLIPGGVNSPVRAFRAVGGDPLYIVRGQGSHIWDADGNEYVDYIGSWGPLILGHAAPTVVEAVISAARSGTSFGASTPTEADLAELVISAFPHMQKVRFVSSGTEATMSAIRLARAYTKRKYIVKFEGCYHGHADALLVKAGSGVATLGIPGSAGVPEEFTQFTLALPYNDTDALEQAFKKFRHQIACVIVEPVVGNMGCVPPGRGYLRSAARHHLARQGAADLRRGHDRLPRRLSAARRSCTRIQPDLTTMGKIIGGGLPVGAYGGASEIMDMVAPLGPVYQAGTLSGNPLAMAAGYATLRYLREHKDIYAKLDKLAGEVVAGVAAAAKDAGVTMCHNRVGSMFTWFFAPGPVTDWNSAAKSDTEAFGRFFRAMLESGIYLPPSQFEAAFMGAAHTEHDVQQTIAAAKQAFAAVHA